MKDKIKELAEYIKESENIVFFGGAGVSTESGIPDFRSADGLYSKPGIEFEKYEPEYLLSHDCLEDDPEVFFEFYRQKMDARAYKPNAAHVFLAKLEKAGKLKAVVTQNIDGLHQKAGSKTVYEIHGTTKSNYCERCGKEYPEDRIFDSGEKIPRCTCGGVIRPRVTLYGEMLPEEAVSGAVSAISKADMLIVGGTSLNVYPASSYIGYFRGNYLAVVNKEPVSMNIRRHVNLEINAPIGEVFKAVSSIIF